MMPRSFKNIRLLPRPVFVAVLLAVSGAFNALTQVTTATFYGIVTDASGGASQALRRH